MDFLGLQLQDNSIIDRAKVFPDLNMSEIYLSQFLENKSDTSAAW